MNDKIIIYNSKYEDTIEITSKKLSKSYYVIHFSCGFDYSSWDFFYCKNDDYCVMISKTNVLKHNFGITKKTRIKLNDAINYLELMELCLKSKQFFEYFLIHDIYIHYVNLLTTKLNINIKFINN